MAKKKKETTVIKAALDALIKGITGYTVTTHKHTVRSNGSTKEIEDVDTESFVKPDARLITYVIDMYKEGLSGSYNTTTLQKKIEDGGIDNSRSDMGQQLSFNLDNIDTKNIIIKATTNKQIGDKDNGNTES